MKNIAGQKIKIIASANNEMSYASENMGCKIREAEDLGWYRFGPVTPIYDEGTASCVMIQVMTRYC